MEVKELTVLERVAVALGTPEHEKKLVELVKQSASIVEIKNVDARTQCHSAYMVLKTARIGIEKAGKKAREDATAFSKAVIEEQTRLVAITETEEARLQGLRDEWDAAREAEKRAIKEAEERRIATIKMRIESMLLDASSASRKTSEEIAVEMSRIGAIEITLDAFGEFTGEAQAKRDQSVEYLREKHAEAVAHEEEQERIIAERAELARLRAEQEERDRQAAAARADQERRDRLIREQEEAERREAQRKADEAMRAERAEHDRRIAADRAELQRQQDEAAAEQRRRQKEIDAEQAAARAELQRQQDELAAQRRAEADAAAEKQRVADLAAAKALREQQERAEAERVKREVADTALRNAAPALLNALEELLIYGLKMSAKHEAPAFQKAREAIALARNEAVV